MNRNFAFDLVRAFTIIVIMMFHITQMTIPNDTVYRIIDVAKYVVDIFFCLSGYLVGILYWREYKKNGTVDLWYFWLRRWSRTLPFYVVFLIFSYAAAYISRKEAFDYTYLFFGQNYRPQLPYFLVSWTLCIEEHFYLFMPLFLSLIMLKKKPKTLLYLSCFLLFFPMLFRINEAKNITDNIPFGYVSTATHLRMDGLLIGVLFSYFHTFKIPVFVPKLRYSCAAIALVVLSSFYLNMGVFYIFGYFFISIFVMTAIYALKEKTLNLSENVCKYIEYIAISSYSLYLSHPLIIHISLILLNKLGIQNPVAKLLFTTILVFTIGFGIYHFFERKLLELRETYIPTIPRKKVSQMASN
jgi:peptidoglycan/LPS O-acetylase OafA/YrhL